MKVRALRNRTLTCNETEIAKLSESLIQLSSPTSVQYITDKIIHQDFIEACHFLPERFVDLLIVDPPYNLTKNYNGHLFRSKQAEDYVTWFEDIVTSFMTILRPNATVYVCSDWKTSNLIFPVLDRYFHVRNRITWEREKGRGAKANCGPMSSARFRIWAKITSPVKYGIWIPAFAGMTIGGASPTLQRQVVGKIAAYIEILKNYQQKRGLYRIGISPELPALA